MSDGCKFMMGRCPFKEERKPMLASDWIQSYVDSRAYLDECESEEQILLLAEAMVSDALASGVVVDVGEMYECLWEIKTMTKREQGAGK